MLNNFFLATCTGELLLAKLRHPGQLHYSDQQRPAPAVAGPVCLPVHITRPCRFGGVMPPYWPTSGANVYLDACQVLKQCACASAVGLHTAVFHACHPGSLHLVREAVVVFD